MSLVFSSFPVPSYINQFKECNLKFHRNTPSILAFIHCKIPWEIPSLTKNKTPTTLKFTARDCMNANYESFSEDNTVSFDWGDEEQREIEQGDVEEDMGSPWEGAVVYKRNSSISHVEYCTTLERLGLAKLSTEVSKSRASIMGLRVTKAVKDFPFGTPVQISIDITRKKQKLRLDGIIRTVITLGCNSCGEPAAQCIFSSFTLLLTEVLIEEPEVINLGVIFGEDKFRTSIQSSEMEEEGDESLIDPDDQLYFPPEKKEIDISKHIRDPVHLEITINALCDPSCKGLCLKCGTNLNTSTCNCSKQEVQGKGYGPLGNLRKQMQQK